MSTGNQNPYEPPLDPHDAAAPPANRGSGEPAESPDVPAVSTSNTVLPRYMAAVIDNIAAMVLAVLVAKSIPDDLAILQLAAAVATYLGYYLLLEGLLARTPGKLATGLVVIQLDGRRCSWRQALVRTVFRLVEVNPALLGALPAAVCIVVSQNHQRFGDRVAGTFVVPADRWGSFRAARKKRQIADLTETTT